MNIFETMQDIKKLSDEILYSEIAAENKKVAQTTKEDIEEAA